MLYSCCYLVAKSQPTLCDPMECSPLGSSVQGVLLAGIWSGLPFPSPPKFIFKVISNIGFLLLLKIMKGTMQTAFWTFEGTGIFFQEKRKIFLGWKNLLMKVKEESEKASLKLSIQKTKTMVSCPITSWQIEGEKWKQWQIFFFLGLQNHCGWWWLAWN